MRVVLGLGSNLGDRLEFISEALRELTHSNNPIIREITLSPIYESPALLTEEAPEDWNLPFYNVAVSGSTALSPEELLKTVKRIEYRIGRKNRPRWSPREIDIDVLTYGNQVVRLEGEEDLVIPHRGLLKRSFVLLPLSDVAPDWVYPGMSVADFQRHIDAPSEIKAELANSTIQVEFLSKVSGITPRLALRTDVRTDLVGILNVTPDSFSDGGKFEQCDLAVRQALMLIEDGAAIIDIGAESTRPAAVPLDPDREWMRLEPVLAELLPICRSHPRGIKISVDTRHPAVASWALEAGVDWINDVSGLDNSEMVEVIKGSTSKIVVMHHLSVPVVKGETLPIDRDPVRQVLDWGHVRLGKLLELGVSTDRIIFDPGIGFGKSAEQCWEILRRIEEFRELGVPLLCGHSRKSFLSSVTSRPFEERDLESAILSYLLGTKGVDYLRVHDIDSTARALNVLRKIRGFDLTKSSEAIHDISLSSVQH